MVDFTVFVLWFCSLVLHIFVFSTIKAQLNRAQYQPMLDTLMFYDASPPPVALHRGPPHTELMDFEKVDSGWWCLDANPLTSALETLSDPNPQMFGYLADSPSLPVLLVEEVRGVYLEREVYLLRLLQHGLVQLQQHQHETRQRAFFLTDSSWCRGVRSILVYNEDNPVVGSHQGIGTMLILGGAPDARGSQCRVGRTLTTGCPA